jgi:Ni,Fe-hydrogenase III component G
VCSVLLWRMVPEMPNAGWCEREFRDIEGHIADMETGDRKWIRVERR